MTHLTPEQRHALASQLQSESAELAADMEARRERRMRGQEPAEWQLPERDPEPKTPPPHYIDMLTTTLFSHIERRLEVLASICGDELGRREKSIRDDAINREAVIRRSVEEVQREVRSAVDQLRQEAKDSMARSASRLLELRETRESMEVDLWQQIMGLQKEVFRLSQLIETRGHGSKANGLDHGGLPAH